MNEQEMKEKDLGFNGGDAHKIFNWFTEEKLKSTKRSDTANVETDIKRNGRFLMKMCLGCNGKGKVASIEPPYERNCINCGGTGFITSNKENNIEETCDSTVIYCGVSFLGVHDRVCIKSECSLWHKVERECTVTNFLKVGGIIRC